MESLLRSKSFQSFEELLHIHSPNEIYESLILSDMNIEPYEIKKRRISRFLIISLQRANLPTVSFLLVLILFQRYVSGLMRITVGFVLSPDMIWLLISQGFARHINANRESMRNELVDFSGKLSLIVREDKNWRTLLFHGRKSSRNLQNKYPNTPVII